MKKYQKLTIQKCEDIQKFLGLTEYTIEYDWENNEGLDGHPAGSSFDYKYLVISFQFAKEFEDDIEDFGNGWLTQTLIHEFCHFFTYLFDEPLKKHLGKREYKLYDERDEQMVERLSKIMLINYLK